MGDSIAVLQNDREGREVGVAILGAWEGDFLWAKMGKKCCFVRDMVR